MNKIDRFIGDMDYDTFLEDEKTMFAVAKAIEIIGDTLKILFVDYYQAGFLDMDVNHIPDLLIREMQLKYA